MIEIEHANQAQDFAGVGFTTLVIVSRNTMTRRLGAISTSTSLEFSRTREFAPALTDLRRRCRLAMGVCQGARCIGPAAALVGSLEQARELLDERWKGHRPVLSGDGLAQAELLQATYFGTGALQHEGQAPWR